MRKSPPEKNRKDQAEQHDDLLYNFFAIWIFKEINEKTYFPLYIKGVAQMTVFS